MKTTAIALALMAAAGSASAALTAGDIAFTGYITNGSPDSFSFVNLVDLTAGDVIYFTDNGWTGSGFRGSSATDGDGNENLIRFTVNSTIAAGTIIRTSATNAAWTWTRSGAIAGATSGSYLDLALGQGGDQITAFTNSNTSNPLFNTATQTALSQIDYTGAFENAVDSSSGNVLPGLSQAQNTAILFNNLSTFAQFNTAALSAGTKDQWLAAINNAANWTFNTTGTSLTGGSISVIPTPGSIALVGLAGVVAGRRRR